ncbi:MAG: transporter, partial [Gammaproteobacteria bacterium]|nr:transporter [Gammaproteobacteria bacterium]
DCIQFVIYIVGALAIAVIIVSDLPGGLNGLMQFASEENKLRLFDFELSLVKPGMTFWAGLAGGIFLTAATHGTDQMMVQRYLSARNQSDAGLALGLSGFVVLLQFALFLLIGVALAGFFSLGSETMVAGVKNDQALAYFIVHYMPVGLLGVTLAAVFAAAMSTLSSSLNASAAALINDLYLPLQKNKQEDEGAKDKRAVNGGLLATIAFGIVQIGLALAFGQLDSSESIVGNVLKISGLAAGPVLGLYFMGVFVKRLDQRPAITGFVLGLLTVFAVAYSTSVYWPWYAFIGSVATLTGGLLAGLLMGRRHG